MTGEEFGWLTAVERVGTDKWRQPIWRCECRCGNMKDVPGHLLRWGNTRSCGCLAKIAHENSAKSLGIAYRRKHGLGEFSYMADMNAGYDLITHDEEVDIECLHTCGLGDDVGVWEEPSVEYDPGPKIDNTAKRAEEAAARAEKKRMQELKREQAIEAARRCAEHHAKQAVEQKPVNKIRLNWLEDFPYTPNPNNAKVRT